eukprot:10563193-Lingulodinium_polyedra.AAC.1
MVTANHGPGCAPCPSRPRCTGAAMAGGPRSGVKNTPNAFATTRARTVLANARVFKHARARDSQNQRAE